MSVFTVRFVRGVSNDNSMRWSKWKDEFRTGMFDSVTGMEVGKCGQLYNNAETEHAFSAPRIEDLLVSKRLKTVVDHFVPNSTASQSRGNTSRSVRRKRC